MRMTLLRLTLVILMFVQLNIISYQNNLTFTEIFYFIWKIVDVATDTTVAVWHFIIWQARGKQANQSKETNFDVW